MIYQKGVIAECFQGIFNILYVQRKTEVQAIVLSFNGDDRTNDFVMLTGAKSDRSAYCFYPGRICALTGL